MTLNEIADFAQLFAGRTDALGSGEGRVIKRLVTMDDYAAHLRGDGAGIGIFPLRDDGTVSFAAIDLDEPDFEAAAEMASLLPGTTFIERSRSGNAHVWAFFKDRIPGWIPRGIMREATAALGRPRVEVFPKQDRLAPGMVGNYINLPYHGADRPIVWLLPGAKQKPVSRKLFIERALSDLNDPDDWAERARFLGIAPPEERVRESSADFGEQPFLHECAEHIIAHRHSNPVRAGHRSVVYFSLAKQLLNWEEMDEDTAWETLKMVEEASPDRIPERELRRIFDNAASGRFTSTGCDDPLMAPYVSPTCPIAHN